MVKPYKDKDIFVFPFTCIKAEEPAIWKRIAIARIHGDFLKGRDIYIPVWEKRAMLCAMADFANTYRYKNFPYVDVDWYIEYYDTINNKEYAKLLRIKRMEWERYLDNKFFKV